MQAAENRNDIALNRKASLYPNAVTEVPPMKGSDGERGPLGQLR